MTGCFLRNFNPRSSCEERRYIHCYFPSCTLFQSTLLMRGATLGIRRPDWSSHNFNPRSSCEERLQCFYYLFAVGYFNPRSSCEERLPLSYKGHMVLEFQSTLLMRGATGSIFIQNRYPSISIHAPHARSDLPALKLRCKYINFNPRSSCEERR